MRAGILGPAALVLFITAGCSSIMRENSDAARTFTANGDPHTLASCVVAAMNTVAGTDYEYIGESDADGVHVTGRAAGSGASGQPSFDVSFTPGAKDQVTVVMKTRASGYGGPQYPDYLVTSLSKCGITG